MTPSDTTITIRDYVTGLDTYGVYVLDGPESTRLLIDESLAEAVGEVLTEYEHVTVYVHSGVLHVDAVDSRYPGVVPVYRIYPVRTSRAEPVIYRYMDERYGSSWSVPDRTSRELNEELKGISSKF